MFLDVQQDLILNGDAYGAAAERLMSSRFDAGLSRPFIDDDGRHCVLMNVGQKVDNKGNIKPVYKKRLVSEMVANGLVVNGPTSLRKLEWIKLDEVVLKAARERLRAWSDLAAANTFGGFNGMASSILEHETMSDAGTAHVDMDGLTEGRNDAPKFQLEGLPLPITHSDFWISARKLFESRVKGMPINMTMGEMAARRVAESVEDTLIGTQTGLALGGTPIAYGRAPKVYGYTNFPSRITYTSITTPTGSNPEATLANVLAMIDLATAKNFYGPFMLYHSNDWDRFMDNDYILTGGNVATQTLRARLKAIPVIQDVRRLDRLRSGTNPYTLILVQMTSDVARAVEGMGITTVQWESMGGMRLNFKVMCIQVPQLRADFNGNCGIVHGTTS